MPHRRRTLVAPGVAAHRSAFLEVVARISTDQIHGDLHLGKRSGPSRTWWFTGKPASVEEWLEDKPTKAKRWSEDGKLTSDDEFERDGSRKLRH